MAQAVSRRPLTAEARVRSQADPSGRTVYVGLRPLACWDCGLESRRGHGCLCCACCIRTSMEHKVTWRKKDLKVQYGSKGNNGTGGKEIPGQSMWDLWWTKWHWGMFFPRVLWFSPVNFIPPVLHYLESLHLHHRLRCVRSICCGALPPSKKGRLKIKYWREGVMWCWR